MRHAIVEKLDRQLHEGISSEPKVVYLFVELRKLLEHDNKKNSYPVLNFYCNWVVHTRIESSAIAEKIIRYMDNLFDYFVPELQEFNAPEQVRRLLDQTSLREELEACLAYFDLPTTICTSQAQWLMLSDHLCRVIEDCPLLIQQNKPKPRRRTKNRGPTKFVESISVSRIPMEEGEGIGMTWNMKFHTAPIVEVKDGRFSLLGGRRLR
jgi:hypothetical protein